MNLFSKMFAVQLSKSYIDRTVRGHGNTAARRAMKTVRGVEHIEFSGEPIYTDHPAVLRNGQLLLLIDRHGYLGQWGKNVRAELVSL